MKLILITYGVITSFLLAQTNDSHRFIFEPPQLEVELGESKTVIVS